VLGQRCHRLPQPRDQGPSHHHWQLPVPHPPRCKALAALSTHRWVLCVSAVRVGIPPQGPDSCCLCLFAFAFPGPSMVNWSPVHGTLSENHTSCMYACYGTESTGSATASPAQACHPRSQLPAASSTAQYSTLSGRTFAMVEGFTDSAAGLVGALQYAGRGTCPSTRACTWCWCAWPAPPPAAAPLAVLLPGVVKEAPLCAT
jgi:hypothetical protein